MVSVVIQVQRKHKKKAEENDIKAFIGEALHKEMQQAFKKDYAKKFGERDASNEMEPSYESNPQGDATNQEPFDNVVDQDALYEKWWQEHGEAYFEKFLKDHSNS